MDFEITLPETNACPVKDSGWKTSLASPFLLKWLPILGDMFNRRSVCLLRPK